MPTASGATRFHALDGLRGWAATVVIFYHSILIFDPTLIQTTLAAPPLTLDGYGLFMKILLMVFNGEYSVTLFFVISGFVLQKSLAARPELGATPILQFIVRRIFRLIPSVVVSVFLVFLVIIIGNRLAGNPAVPTLRPYFDNAFLLGLEVHPVTGTIQLEMLAIPFLLIVSMLVRSWGTLGAFFGIAYGLLAMQNPFPLNNLNLHSALLPFSVGILIASPIFEAGFRNLKTGAILACLVCFIFARIFGNHGQIAASIAQVILAGGLIASIAYASGNSFKAFLERDLSQFLGRISYSLYLNASVVGSALFATIRHYTTLNPNYAAVGGIVTGLIVFFIAIPIAVFLEQYVERPGIAAGAALIRSFKPKPIMPIVPAAAE